MVSQLNIILYFSSMYSNLLDLSTASNHILYTYLATCLILFLSQWFLMSVMPCFGYLFMGIGLYGFY